MNRFKKLLRNMTIVGLTIVVLTSCTANKSKGQEPSIGDIEREIKESVDISDMVQSDKEKLEKLYQVDGEDVEDFILYLPSKNIEANELAIIKVKDVDKIDTIEANIASRIEEKSNAFKDYLPDEYYLIEKHVLKTKDNYILFVIWEDGEKIEKIFDESFK
ncbi:DUF4358 domain-containing protein [Clostridium sp. Cult3]|uniref:DUF4358 domain-containing protein n=1 Tax=Clostridium sp. Cult3 TaxID=2079004 RepID=UPI001F3C10E5|nr:DUF4358 domain-containing protein [Clostridium sp. Cult3]